VAAFELVSFLHPDNPALVRLPPSTVVVNNDLHLIHTVAGEGRARIGSREFTMEPGQIIFIEPHIEYCVECVPRRRLEMLNFHFHCILGNGVSLCRALTLPTDFRPKKFAQIERNLRLWHKAWSAPSLTALKGATIVARLHALLVEYLSEFGRAPSPRPADAEMETLARLLADEKQTGFDAARCAAAVFMSVSQMNRRFRASHGAAPKDFWLRRRFAHARHRLHYQAPHEPIAAIARALGFDDANYFSRWFKAFAGVSPREFRERAKAMQV
jgi:AraC-like DNA-binding protein